MYPPSKQPDSSSLRHQQRLSSLTTPPHPPPRPPPHPPTPPKPKTPPTRPPKKKKHLPQKRRRNNAAQRTVVSRPARAVRQLHPQGEPPVHRLRGERHRRVAVDGAQRPRLRLARAAGSVHRAARAIHQARGDQRSVAKKKRNTENGVRNEGGTKVNKISLNISKNEGIPEAEILIYIQR